MRSAATTCALVDESVGSAATKKAEKGGRIMALYTLMPGGKNLIVAYLLEHKTLRKPLEARMIFDRDEEAE